MILKKISVAAENSENEEYFKIVDQTMKALDGGVSNEITEAWFYLNFAKAMGEQVNLFFDLDGDKLSETERYSWNAMEGALFKNLSGEVNAEVMKTMRLMLAAGLDVVVRIKGVTRYITTILGIAKAINKI